MNNTYGTPPKVIPISIAAAAAEMTVAELTTALAGEGLAPVKMGPYKTGVKPADLEAVSEGASVGLRAYGHQDLAARDHSKW